MVLLLWIWRVRLLLLCWMRLRCLFLCLWSHRAPMPKIPLRVMTMRCPHKCGNSQSACANRLPPKQKPKQKAAQKPKPHPRVVPKHRQRHVQSVAVAKPRQRARRARKPTHHRKQHRKQHRKRLCARHVQKPRQPLSLGALEIGWSASCIAQLFCKQLENVVLFACTLYTYQGDLFIYLHSKVYCAAWRVAKDAGLSSPECAAAGAASRRQ